MAAGQFSTSRPRRSSRSRKYFTVEQANRSLPLVTRIVRDIVNAHDCAAQLQAKLESASGKAAAELHAQLKAILDSLQDYIDELASVGIELKDFETGLVDFPGRHQDRDICLCWRLGEEKVAYWHELHTGFAGRQPVSTLDTDPPIDK